jgi:hypothetical protein
MQFRGPKVEVRELRDSNVDMRDYGIAEALVTECCYGKSDGQGLVEFVECLYWEIYEAD